ncbi:hypothetical protein PHYSODRAFT_484559 [Phytophthora sojae]|uniref:Uncharacterized protein n=1 Tax=Phytophthora sojae (strain P6497) TaxID=1094619 RepID=G4Z1E8_PHYSP|nr:hypothetical protein PHYSODRAFT_484559 [Phytophthora sojae]EGZ25296.1 hypothetical protein PHYSODRAFT_484559 [Phytophthora sojae]|eukprot:XP_009520584.1 hypothetical protein PHYSODRAFT_484559 [Phytophthora sojae]
MKAATDKQTSRRLVGLPNNALVQILTATVARLHNLEMEINELELAIDDDQKEVESFTHEIDERYDRLRDIDEFVVALEAGAVSSVPDVPSVLAEMAEEREEERIAITRYKEARGWQEQQFQKLQQQCRWLRKERVALHKTCIEICSIFRRNGVFALMTRKLANLQRRGA